MKDNSEPALSTNKALKESFPFFDYKLNDHNYKYLLNLVRYRIFILRAYMIPGHREEEMFHLYTWWNLAYLNQTFRIGLRALVWSGEAYLSYSLAATFFFVSFIDQLDQKLLKLKLLLF
ncbi:hypothetical protein M8C21_001856 [Ambrosia artemisiifolia]|uniref:Uncharacterized protein n=1 Tax=Ambrosia artemisiifolia TaxID=4212 RepID=A0AAD5CWD7_AMBAR|nr:hypothetical protein M8C21_001856 [Ambrosia artemisiifolia]